MGVIPVGAIPVGAILMGDAPRLRRRRIIGFNPLTRKPPSGMVWCVFHGEVNPRTTGWQGSL